MNKSESKYFNTALRMDEALIALLEIKDLEYITVKEICEKAGVNRSTFYLHYETIADLVTEAMENINKRFLAYFAQGSGDIFDSLSGRDLDALVLVKRDYLIPYLQFVRDNQKVYRAAFRNPNGTQSDVRYANLKKHIFEPILEKFEVPEAFRRYYIAYYFEGILAIIREWLNNGCSDSIETIASVIEACVKPSDSIDGHPPGV